MRDSVVVANVVPDPRPSGPLLRVLRVAEYLCEHGFETHIITDGSIEESILEKARDQVSDVHLTSLPRMRSPDRVRKNINYLFSAPQTILRISQLLQKIDADVTHVNGWLTLTPAIASTRCQIPVVWHINDMLVPKPLAKITKPVVSRCSDTIAVASEAVAEYFFQDRKIGNVLYSQVDVNRFSPGTISGDQIRSMRTKFSITSTANIVGTVGNISPNKGHDVFIEAVPSILKQNPNTIFVIVGRLLETKRDYYQSLLDRAQELEVRSQIVFTGYQTEIPEILSMLDVFVFPSRSEACPQSVLEAMAMELPVIASRTGGIVEQITEGRDGLLVPTGNPRAIAENVNTLLSCPHQAEVLGKRARQTVVEKFSIENCAERHAELYKMAI